jgi:hypothetical protein
MKDKEIFRLAFTLGRHLRKVMPISEGHGRERYESGRRDKYGK